MTKKRFHVIGRNLIFTDVLPPNFIDKFWQIHQMICAWNEHMANTFVAAWIACVDESMSIWDLAQQMDLSRVGVLSA